jgi:hypothetical protein
MNMVPDRFLFAVADWNNGLEGHARFDEQLHFLPKAVQKNDQSVYRKIVEPSAQKQRYLGLIDTNRFRRFPLRPAVTIDCACPMLPPKVGTLCHAS